MMMMMTVIVIIIMMYRYDLSPLCNFDVLMSLGDKPLFLDCLVSP